MRHHINTIKSVAADNADFVQLREDFESVYGKKMRNVRLENGCWYFEAGNDSFPTSFRGFVRGEFSYIDPWTDETNEIKDGHCTHRNMRFSDVF